MNALLASQRNTTLRICLLAATALGGFARSAWADVMVGAGDGSAGNPYVLSGSGDITSYVLNNQNVQLSGGGKFTITIPQTGTNVLAGPTPDAYLYSPRDSGYSTATTPTINYTGVISGSGSVEVRSGFNSTRASSAAPFTGGILLFNNNGQTWGLPGSSGGTNPSALIVDSNVTVDFFHAGYFMCASKKGVSAHQLHRTLEISYKAAWFLCHRIREAMRDDKSIDFLGGANKVVEADETYIGGKARNRAHREPAKKKAVLSLVERDGRVRSFHVANVTAESVKPIIARNADKASMLMTDESVVYTKLGKEFAGHGTVNHSASEYARLGGFVGINASENFFSIVKRGIVGTYHSVSEAHLHRYLAEFDFRYNNRTGLGVEDQERTGRAIAGVVGKRLTYKQSSGGQM